MYTTHAPTHTHARQLAVPPLCTSRLLLTPSWLPNHPVVSIHHDELSLTLGGQRVTKVRPIRPLGDGKRHAADSHGGGQVMYVH